MPKKPPKNLQDFDALIEIMSALRSPEGCPWDRKQTPKTLAPYAVEEAHELAYALENGSQEDVVEELGDLLLQVVFHAEIGSQENRFSIDDVIESINTKLINRHPHVFADVRADTAEEVLSNWGEIKAAEKKNKGKTSEPFDIPLNMPALVRAEKIGHKTRKLKFDWNRVEEVVGKVEEELEELKQAIKADEKDNQEHELGDLLFSVAQLSRHMGFEAEQALRLANNKFERRFMQMKELAKKKGLEFEKLPQDELEELWVEVKNN
jgi:MazG family protein